MKTIFVQDDIPLNTLLCKVQWQKEGYEVITCNDITKAYDIIVKTKPHLIFCDILEPNINGIEFCSLLKDDALTKDIPFCFLTSLYCHNYFIKGINAGANGYVTKPATPYDMIAYIPKLMKSTDGGYVPRIDNPWSIYKEITTDCFDDEHCGCKTIRDALLKIEKENPQTWESKIRRLLEQIEYFTEGMLIDNEPPQPLHAPYIEFTINNEPLYQSFIKIVNRYRHFNNTNKRK